MMMMKIQCNACEAAEANVLCCAEEAALCWACDHKIHAASKLASEHRRLPLSSSSPFPNCDICQVSVGYFFCAQDRALLGRKCDVAIHTADAFVSSHERFLLTGVKVGLLQSTLPGSLRENLIGRLKNPPSRNRRVPVVYGAKQHLRVKWEEMELLQQAKATVFKQSSTTTASASGTTTVPVWHSEKSENSQIHG